MRVITISIVAFSCIFLSCESKKDEKPFGTLIEVPTEAVSIKEAVEIAQPGDTILIEPGEYFEWDIEIKKSLCIFSNFIYSSDSTVITETIINGNRESRIFTISNITDTVYLNGFTITEAHAKSKFPVETELLAYNGGGLYCFNANVKLSNLSISNNLASEPNSRGDGGGMYIDSSFVELNNVTIYENSALNTGGAIYCSGSTLNIYNSVIDGNVTTISGGPPVSITKSSLDFNSVLFQNNMNSIDAYPDFLIHSSEGVFENVKSIHDSIYFDNSSINLINCDLPGLMIEKNF